MLNNIVIYSHEKGHRHAHLCDEYLLKTYNLEKKLMGSCPNQFPKCCTTIFGRKCVSAGGLCLGMPHNPDYNHPDSEWKYYPQCEGLSIMGPAGANTIMHCNRVIYPQIYRSYCQLRSNIWGECQRE